MAQVLKYTTAKRRKKQIKNYFIYIVSVILLFQQLIIRLKIFFTEDFLIYYFIFDVIYRVALKPHNTDV